MANATLAESWQPPVRDTRTGSLERWFCDVGAPQAVFHRCACGCRFRWPKEGRRVEFHTPEGAVEEVHELAECPKCGSTRSRVLAEPWPRVYFNEEEEGQRMFLATEGSGRRS